MTATRRPDISSRDDVTALVEDFYGRAFDDALLGPVFVDVAHMNLGKRLPVICEFWLTVLFHTGQYRRNTRQPHLRLHERAHLTGGHFERWLTLWLATVDDRHAGPTADLAKLQATRIAGSMARRLARVECAAQVDELRKDHESRLLAASASPTQWPPRR